MSWLLSLAARFLPSFLPGLGAFLNPWVLALIAGLSAFLWFDGYEHGRDKLDDYIAQQAVAAQKIVTRQGQVTERVVDHYIHVRDKAKVVTRTITQEVNRYVSANPDSLCLDARWRLLHDAAATGTLSSPSERADGPMRASQTPSRGAGSPHSGTGAGDRDGELRPPP